ncbi:UNVERIFIED_CONTAM: hypothetical protein Sradi_6126700 [Sesamum radiatum]|uniref:Uncharacterized protein n=1 Tax=Sesamum radiatum TaxID=300843 RepID=A0AAW2KJU4_SESRA
MAENFFWIKTLCIPKSFEPNIFPTVAFLTLGLGWKFFIHVEIPYGVSIPDERRAAMGDWSENLGESGGQPFVVAPPTFKLVCQPQTLPVDATVSSLLNEGCSRRWELILEDAKCILQCKVGDCPNKLIWQCHPKGKFMVRSVYGVTVARGYQS